MIRQLCFQRSKINEPVKRGYSLIERKVESFGNHDSHDSLKKYNASHYFQKQWQIQWNILAERRVSFRKVVRQTIAGSRYARDTDRFDLPPTLNAVP